MNENLYADLGINPLTAEQRDSAYNAARLKIAGEEPVPEQFQKNAFQKYSPLVMRIITALSVVMLVASFIPSAMRLHDVALHTSLAVLGDAMSAYVSAIAAVLMAEIGQVIFSLAAAAAPSKAQRLLLFSGVVVCTWIAFVGNAAAFGPRLKNGPFVVLEAFAPPFLVLITSQVLKAQILHGDESRYEAYRNYETAYFAWNERFIEAHKSAEWDREAANAIKAALETKNARSTAKVRALSNMDWNQLVRAERAAEDWFIQNLEAISVYQPSNGLPTPSNGTNGTSIGNAVEEPASIIPSASTLGHSKQPMARKLVEEYFQQNPAALDMSPIQVAERLGVGKSTVYNVIKDMRSAQIPDTEADTEEVIVTANGGT